MLYVNYSNQINIMFNIIGNVCSILSLLISIFVATKVIKIDNSTKKSTTIKSKINGNENVVSGDNTTITR